MATFENILPTEEELAVQEVNLSIAALRAGAFHLGKYCEYDNNEFMLCKDELIDPRKCIEEGKAVTRCAVDFFRKLKQTCYEEFQQYATCLDKSSAMQAYNCCRKTQSVFDECVLNNLDIERPDYGYFCRVKVHDSERPKPEKEQPTVYSDAPVVFDPPQEELPRAKYGPRYLF